MIILICLGYMVYIIIAGLIINIICCWNIYKYYIDIGPYYNKFIEFHLLLSFVLDSLPSLSRDLENQWSSNTGIWYSCSQEVVWGSSVEVRFDFILLWSWVELKESVFHEFIYFHYCCLVTTSVAVVRCWEHCDDVSVVRPVVAIHYKLMGSGNQLQVIWMVELFGDVLSKRITSTSWWDTPTTSVIRVWPKKITNWTFVWHFHNSV